MSLKMTRLVWQHSRTSGSVRLLMVALADYATDDAIAFPSLDSLAVKLCTTRRNVIRLVAKAAESGELIVMPGGGRRRMTHYYLRPGNSDAADTVRNSDAPAETVTFRDETVTFWDGNSDRTVRPSVTVKELPRNDQRNGARVNADQEPPPVKPAPPSRARRAIESAIPMDLERARRIVADRRLFASSTPDVQREARRILEEHEQAMDTVRRRTREELAASGLIGAQNGRAAP